MKFSVQVKDVMKKNIKTVNIDDTIEKAAVIMKKEKIGSVVVLDSDVLMGIVTTSDIVYKHVAGKTGSVVADIMSTSLVKISPEKTIEDAAHMMVKNNIEKLLVFDNEKLVGIITATDILRVEPALFEILLERMKIGNLKTRRETQADYVQCEICGNYAENIEEIDGIYKCRKCRS